MDTSNGAVPVLHPALSRSSVSPEAPVALTAGARPDPEVVARPPQARRRTFTAAYKLRILDEAAHTAIGQLGALLRREGLYSSHLANWRRERARGALTPASGAAPRRGRPAVPAAEREVARLREENARLARKLVAAETVIEVQKKVAALLGLVPLDSPAPPVPPAPPASGNWRR